MQVIRVEDDSGYGPFRSNSAGCFAMTMAVRQSGNERLNNKQPDGYWHEHLPSPYEEGLDRACSDFCGVISFRHLVMWFPRPIRVWLHNNGFKFAVYEVPEDYVEEGATQVIFSKVFARKMGEFPIYNRSK